MIVHFKKAFYLELGDAMTVGAAIWIFRDGTLNDASLDAVLLPVIEATRSHWSLHGSSE
ncbi:Hypothetical protein A7982_06631 [Minicystis rosea]|nr:Hypothetical protein A7982_06631 [Minicystis rosea]